CDRGRYNIGFYTSPDRVTQPLYKQGDGFVQIAWDDAFVLWGDAIKSAVGKRGPKTIGAIGGGRLTNEEAYLLQHVFRAFGVANLDWRSGRQRQASPGKAGGSLAALENAQVVVIVGESPAERAPVMDLRIRKARRKHGAKIVDFTTAKALSASVPKETKRVALVWDGVDPALAREALGALGAYDVATYITGEQPNARGAEAMGMLPALGPGYAKADAGMDGDAMLAAARDGRLDVLYLAGVNPALNHPDRALVSAALQKTPFVVASELFLTQTAQAATLVLPVKGAFEKHGTTINLAGDLLPVNASIQAPEGVYSDLDVLAGLARQLGVALPTLEELDAAVVAAAAKVVPLEFGDALLGAGARDAGEAAPTQLFAGGGTSAHDPRIQALRPC
ncbi:MAG TPA: molybdopterin-dependent oxidoreductase, partial [Candidatus Baltobacteraceae bacterium]